jgi:hypothetical protein
LNNVLKFLFIIFLMAASTNIIWAGSLQATATIDESVYFSQMPSVSEFPSVDSSNCSNYSASSEVSMEVTTSTLALINLYYEGTLEGSGDSISFEVRTQDAGGGDLVPAGGEDPSTTLTLPPGIHRLKLFVYIPPQNLCNLSEGKKEETLTFTLGTVA